VTEAKTKFSDAAPAVPATTADQPRLLAAAGVQH